MKYFSSLKLPYPDAALLTGPMVYQNVGFLLKHALIRIVSRLRHPHWQLAPVRTAVWHPMPLRYANVNLVW